MPFPNVIARFTNSPSPEEADFSTKEEDSIQKSEGISSRLFNSFSSFSTSRNLSVAPSSSNLSEGGRTGSRPERADSTLAGEETAPNDYFVKDEQDEHTPQSKSSRNNSISSYPAGSPGLTDPELSTKLLFHYIKSYQTHLENKVLGLNPATLRYIGSRIREMKRAPPNARFSILDFFRKSEELSSYDFAHIEECFKHLKKVAIVGNNNASELDLRYFHNLVSLRVSKCEVVYISEPEEWFLFNEYRLNDIRIIKCSFPLSSMKSVPYKLIVVESPLDWSSISERWISKLQEIECSRSKVNELSRLLVPEIARKVTNQEEIQSQQGDGYESDSCTEGMQLYTGWLELSRLSIVQNNIRQLDQSLLYCPSLEHLDLRNNQMESLEASVLPRPLSKLKTLIVRNNFLNSLENSANLLSNVRVLDVSHNQLKSTIGIENAPSLEVLDISHNSLYDWRDVRRLKVLSNLQSLHIHHNVELERNDDYRIMILSYLLAKTKIQELDGKIISAWERSNVVVHSDTDDDEQIDNGKSHSIPTVDTPKAKSKKQKKKLRKRMRTVNEIPEFTKTPKQSSPVVDALTPDASTTKEEPISIDNSEMFFSHMSHFYEPVSEGIEPTSTSPKASGNVKVEKDLEWTKRQLTSMLEDGGDQWLLILNEYLNPDRKTKTSSTSERKKLTEEDSVSSVDKNQILEKSLLDSNIQSNTLQSNRSKVPSLRNPIQQTRVVVDYINNEVNPLIVYSHNMDSRRYRPSNDIGVLFNEDEELLKMETVTFFRELGLEDDLDFVEEREAYFEQTIHISDISDDDSTYEDYRESASDADTQDPRAFVSVAPSGGRYETDSSFEYSNEIDKIGLDSDFDDEYLSDGVAETQVISDAIIPRYVSDEDVDALEEEEDQKPKRADLSIEVPHYSSQTQQKSPTLSYQKKYSDSEVGSSKRYEVDSGESALQSESTLISPDTPVDNSNDTPNDVSSVDDDNIIHSNEIIRSIEETSKQSTTIISGYLHKEGGVWKNWKRRYFRLTDGFWTYGKEPQGIIDAIETSTIRSVKAMVHKKGPKKFQRFGFIVSVEGEHTRNYKVCAESESELKEWMDALKSVIHSRDSMLLATNGDIFKLKHVASNIYMDISNTGELIFSKDGQENNARWRYINGRIINENLGSALVANTDGACHFASPDKNVGREAIWKSSNNFIMNERKQYLTLKFVNEQGVAAYGYATDKKTNSTLQSFVVI